MKRKTSHIQNKKITPITLYLDDLEYIIEKASSQDISMHYSDNEYEFDSFEEIKKYRGNRIKHLSIVLQEEKEGYSSFDIVYKNGTLKFSSWRLTDKLRLLFRDIVDYFTSKQPVLFYAFNSAYYLYALAGLLGASTWHSWKPPLSTIATVHLYLFGCVTVMLSLSLLVKHYFSYIYLDRKHDADSFWRRNRDKLILLIIGSIIGIIGKWIIGHFF